MAEREYVVISGYYGFDNLGDEAILEEIIAEASRLVSDKSKIVVLSQNPEKTHRVFGVNSVNRWKMAQLQPYFAKARLFISGGGGLYQDSSSVKSVVYYFGLALLAKLSGAPTVIYAQGVGPLKSPISVALTKTAMGFAQEIAVRDSNSVDLLKSWGISKARLTADPVWCLQPTALPAETETALSNVPPDSYLLGLSIRESHHISPSTVEAMAHSLADGAPAGTVLVPLILQHNQDAALLQVFSSIWKSKGHATLELDFSKIERPSQWLSLLSRLNLVVGMRFHALLMALKSGVPAVGLAYDPKVSYLMKNFEQPCLNLAKSSSDNNDAALARELANLVAAEYSGISDFSERAARVTASQNELACQNFDVIARILKS